MMGCAGEAMPLQAALLAAGSWVLMVCMDMEIPLMIENY
jgi:hypothetical protein